MKVRVRAGNDSAGLGPSGSIDAFFPGDVIPIDDNDEAAVAWARVRVETGFVEIVEDVARKIVVKKEA